MGVSPVCGEGEERENVKKKLSDLMGNLVGILILLAIAAAIGGCVNYRIDLYKRKFPGTSTLDYWLDSHK